MSATALGAWQYAIPPDASEQNIDWDRFLGSAPERPFEPIRLFRWRNYRDYGTGVAGDLFVHLFSRLHTVVDSIGPSLVFAAGGLRYWKDGRDVPDVMLAVVDYPASASHPAITFSLRVNLKSGVPAERFGAAGQRELRRTARISMGSRGHEGDLSECCGRRPALGRGPVLACGRGHES